MISKVFFRLLPVQILLIAVGCLNSVIDGAVAASAIGPDAMAVLGLYAPVGKCVDALVAVFLGGSQIMCGRFLGRNEVEETQRVFSLDIVVTLGISCMLAALFLAIPGSLAAALGAGDAVRTDLAAYLAGMAPGIPAQMIGSQLSAFLQLERQEKRTYIGIAAMVITNVGMDLLLVTGLGMGFLGLGLATSVSSLVFCAVQLAFFMTDRATIRFHLRSVRFRYLPELLRTGVPGALTQGCLVLRGLIINAILLRYAAPWGLPAFSAVNAFGCLYCAVYLGMGSATRLLTSVYIGEEDRTGLMEIMRIALTWGLALVTVAAGITLALAEPFTRLFFQPGDGAYEPALLFFRLFPLSVPLSSVFITFVNYYQSAGRIKAVNFLSVIDGVAAVSLFSILLAPPLGYLGVWLAQPLAGLFTTAMIPLCAWVINRRFSLRLADLMALRPDFGAPAEDRMELTVTGKEQALQTSRAVIDFCLRHGTDRKRAYSAGLCLEELAVNIVDHGFRKGREDSVVIRVLYRREEDELLIRLKDGCRPFNPKERAALFDPEDPLHNVGIRMASRLSKRMEYQFILGLNVLTVTL